MAENTSQIPQANAQQNAQPRDTKTERKRIILEKILAEHPINIVSDNGYEFELRDAEGDPIYKIHLGVRGMDVYSLFEEKQELVEHYNNNNDDIASAYTQIKRKVDAYPLERKQHRINLLDEFLRNK